MARRQRYATEWRTDESQTRMIWEGAQRPVKVRPEKPYPSRTPLAGMSVRLGHSPTGGEVRVGASDLFRHAVTTGPTGYGKTTTLLRLMHAVVVQWEAAWCPLVMFDFKADPSVRDSLRDWAQQTGRQFWFVSVTEDGDLYDPMATGSPEELASRLVETIASAKDGGFSEPHHRSVGERWLIATLLVLDDLARARVRRPERLGGHVWRRSLSDLAVLMHAPVLRTERTHTAVSAKAKARALQLLDEITEVPDLGKSIAGMRTRIALMAETAAGEVLQPAADGLQLEQAVRDGAVVLFSLSAATNAAAARVVGNLAIFDLGSLFDRLQHESWAAREGRRAFVVFDEFSGLGGDALQSLYERARSGGGALISSTQTGAGFLAVSDEFSAAVWGNSNTWLLHHQDEGDVEDRSAAMGTERGWTETVQVHEDASILGTTGGGTGVGSLRRTDHYRVHPNELRSLGIGQVVMFRKATNSIDRVAVEEVAGASTGRVLTPRAHDQDADLLEDLQGSSEESTSDEITTHQADAVDVPGEVGEGLGWGALDPAPPPDEPVTQPAPTSPASRSASARKPVSTRTRRSAFVTEKALHPSVSAGSDASWAAIDDDGVWPVPVDTSASISGAESD